MPGAPLDANARLSITNSSKISVCSAESLSFWIKTILFVRWGRNS